MATSSLVLRNRQAVVCVGRAAGLVCCCPARPSLALLCHVFYCCPLPGLIPPPLPCSCPALPCPD